MSLLDDVFAKLKTSIVGTKTASIDTKLDNAAKDIVAYRSQTSRNNYIELIKNLVTKTGIDGNFTLPQGTTQGGLNPSLFGQAARVQRYHMYDAITSNISYCHRALRVLVDNILAPDDITKSSLEIKPKTNLDKDTDSTEYTKTMREFLDSIKLEDYLDPIVKNTLHMGDFFCEIADDKTALISKSAFLTEGEQQKLNENTDTLDFKITENQDISQYKIILDYSAFDDGDESKGKMTSNKIKLLYYEPKRIIKLQSSIFPICFGYLVFPLAVFSPQLMIQDQTINTICSGILKSLEKKVPNLNINTIDSKDLVDTIRLMVRESDPGRALNIRYVPPDKMQHFMIPSTKYYPYGESIFDACQFSAKVLIALETAVTIHRINRSIQKRKIAIEIGLPRDAKKAIERLKEEFRKRKISMDSFGSVDTIPSMVTSFEDIYLPQKDGKPFVDITPFDDAGSDTGRGRVEELKFMRDSIVATLMVPPSFLAIEENLSNKCIELHEKIKLLSGKNISLIELVNEFNNTGQIKDKWTYSYDVETSKIVPGKIIWGGVTRKNAKVVKVTLDNGESNIVTPDHHFMLRNGTYIEAKDLKPGDSLMPLYTKLTHIKTSKKVPYELVYHPGLDMWQETYRMVALHEGIVNIGDELNVHHEDLNPMNNSPCNLQGLTNKEHAYIHIQHKNFITTGRGNVNLENYIEDTCIICGKKFTRHIKTNQTTCLKECRRERSRLDGIKSFEKRKYLCSPLVELQCPYCGEIFARRQSYIDDIKSGIITCGEKECYKKSFVDFNNTPERKKIASEAGKKGIGKRKNRLAEWNKNDGFKTCVSKSLEARGLLNHKVVSVKWLTETVDTGDITVEKYHNFSLSSGIIVSNSALSEENIIFARTIVNHQKFFTTQVEELITKIYRLVDPEKVDLIMDNVSITLPSPKSLQFEREAKYTSDLANLIQTLETIGVPREWAKRKYLTSIDWEEVDKFKIEQDIDRNLKTGDQPAEGGELGMGAGLGGVGGLGGMGGTTF